MLNYTSKIQHFLNLHRKHTKYIVVLLLLSAFVASFVCSALTEPAVSMTNQSFDITTNLSVDSDGATQDGLPIIDESYSSGQFSAYMNEAAPLGIATRFGLFAFESVDIIAHCNTNLATPNATIGAPFGSSQIAAEGGQEITLITDSLSIGDITSNNTVLLFPESVNFVDEQDNFVSINPLPRVKINNGETKHINQGSTKMYAYHVRKEAFINWTEEKNNYIERQNDWIDKNNTADNYSIYVKAWYDENDENNKTISRIEIPNEGEYYLYIPYNKLPNGSRELNITLGKNVTLIINVDLSGAGETYDANFQITGSQGGSNFTNESSALEKGMNLLWNFYDSSDNQNNQYTGTINMVKPGVGCIVAPSANVNIDASFAGTIVANNIKTTATFSKSMFKTVVIAEETDIAVMAHKEWDDGKENHTNDSVTVQLYKSLSPNASLNDLKDSDKEGDPRILNAGNNWNDTWFGLDRSYYYYVKEISTGNYYCETEYGNNGRDTTGTITVKNKVIKTEEIDPNAKLDLTIQMYWSDDAKAHTYCNGAGCDCDEDSNNKIQHKNKTVLIYRSTSKDFNPANLTDAEQKRKHSIVKKDDNDNYIQENTMLYYDSEKGTTSTFIDSRDDWKKTITGLPVMNSSKQIYYYYAVFPYNTGGIYMFEYSNNGVSGKSDTITVGCIKMLQLTVNKTWENESNKNEVIYKVYQSRTKADYKPSDAKEINSISYTEYVNENQTNTVNATFRLNNNNVWTETIGRSPQLPQSTIYGEKYYYYVEETSISGSELNKYNISYTNNGFNDDAAVTINNQKKEAGNFSIKVTKNKPNALKAATTAVLYRITTDGNWDNAEKVGTQPLSESNNWQCTFTALPLKEKDSSKSYYYKVVEDGSSPGFNVTYSNQVIDTSGITENVEKQVDIYYNEKTVTINVKKIWNNISPDLIKHVIVKVYRYKGNGTQAMNLDDYIYSNNGFVMGNLSNIVNTLNDSSLSYELSNENKTVTYKDLAFNNAPDTSSYYYEAKVNLSQFAGNVLIGYKIKFTTDTPNLKDYQDKNGAYYKNHMLYINNGHKYFNGNGPEYTENIRENIGESSSLIISSINTVDYGVSYIELTFENAITTGGSTGGTTPTIPTGTLNGNVLTFDYSSNPMSPNDTTSAFSREQYTFVYSLVNAEGRRIKKVEIEFNENPNFDSNSNSYNLVFDNQTTLDNESTTNYGLLKWGYEFKGNQSGCSFDTNNHKITYEVGTNNDSNTSLREIEEDDYLVFTAGNSEPNFKIKKVIVTFADSNNNQNQNQITFPGYWWNGEKTELNFNGLSSVNDTNAQYSDNSSKYNFVYKLPSDAYGKQITKIEYTFNDNHYIQYGRYRILCGTQDKLKDPSNAVLVKIIDGSIPSNEGLSYNSGTVTYVVSGDKYYNQNGNDRLGALSSSEDSYLVFATSDTNNAPTFQITNLKITFASTSNSTAIHDDNYHSFNNEYTGQNIWIDNQNLHSKPISSVEMIFKKKLTQTPDMKVYDIWLRDSSNNKIADDNKNLNGNITECTINSVTHYVATWNYSSNPTATQVGARTIYNTTNDIYGIRVNYTDGSTYTINNSNAQSSTSDYVTYEYYFENYKELYMTQSSYYTLYIPENFKDKPVQKIEAYYENLSTFNPDDRSNFENNFLNMWFKGKDGYDFYNNNFEERSIDGNTVIKDCSKADTENRKGVNEIVIRTGDHAQNLQYVKVTFDNGSITINNKRYGEGGFATGSGNQGGNTETLEHSETINVLSTNLNADGNLDYSKSLAWQIPDQFRGFTVKEIKAEFHNRNILTREGTEYYNTVFNMNIYAINDKQLYENWDIGDLGDDYKSKFDDKDHLIYKRYLPKNYNNEEKYSYSELDFLIICTAYTENLKEIVITFEGGHTITLTNKNAGTNIEEPLEYNPYDITLVETITLTAGNKWEHILYNQPMVAPDGTPYYYVIEEIEIEYNDGTKLSSAISISNLFEVESTILNALELEENPENNILAVTNSLKLTNANMPSTGGIGTHPYRNAGILMMICSGGIYISLRALRKKQN